MAERSKLVSLRLKNLGCIGPEGLEVALDNIVCLVGRNNTGKSTVLRAYELAQASQVLQPTDYCQWAEADDFPEVELAVHIPDGIGNVDARWKKSQDGLKIVRSRWQWRGGGKPTRKTWDPGANGGEGEWAEDGKAGGADNVFSARLPQPIRVDSLQDAFTEHDQLLELVTGPVVQEIKKMQEDSESELRKSIDNVLKAAMGPINAYKEDIAKVSGDIQSGFNEIFPGLHVQINVSMEPPSINAAKSILAGSSIRFKEGDADTGIKQQGTGSRRALFWALLQVRNSIEQRRKAQVEQEKQKAKLNCDLQKEQNKKKPDEDKVQEILAKIEAFSDTQGPLTAGIDLPGYILLIDEPENCLHPMAVRAARSHLYKLAEDPNWQVMISTHSPYFIDPLEDHTTIVRLERVGKLTSPRTFRTATAQFSNDERENLRALLQLDTSLAEMFFGSYPILIEGDTELAAYIAASGTDSNDVSLVPARGKALLVPLIKLLTHFGVSFGILHDSDSPKTSKGKRNPAWKQNENIANAICDARKKGLKVIHRISIPDFERLLDGVEESKDKPITAYRRVKEHHETEKQVSELFHALHAGVQCHPFDALDENAEPEEILEHLKAQVLEWAGQYAPGDQRFKIDAEDIKVQEVQENELQG